MNAQVAQSLKFATVLYAEDDPTIRQEAVRQLKKLCGTVLEAENGRQALELFASHMPDIILADIRMPVMNGLELVRKIREQGSDVPAVMITAHVKEEYLFDALRLSLVDYLVKPFSFSALEAALQKCVTILAKNGQLKIPLGDGIFYHIQTGILEGANGSFELSRKERLLLSLLLKHKNRLVSKAEIEQAVWPDEGMSESALKSVLVKLRRKIGKTTLVNTPHMGYRILLPHAT